MKKLLLTTILLSLASVDVLFAFQIKTEIVDSNYGFPPGAVIGKIRSDFNYDENKQNYCVDNVNTSEKWTKVENELKSELRKAGIYEGVTVWCKDTKTKHFELPALTKIVIKKIELLTEMYAKSTGETKCSDIYTLVTVDTGGKEKILQFGDYAYEEDRAYDVIRSFHTKNPSAKWSKKAISAIKEGKVYLGMTKAQATESWGKPKEVNRSVGSWGTKEQWVYRNKSYLYFTNDKLDSFQD